MAKHADDFAPAQRTPFGDPTATDGHSDYDKLLIAYLERIASALEEANRLNSPAHELNAFNVKQLRAATGQEGIIVGATLVPSPNGKKNH